MAVRKYAAVADRRKRVRGGPVVAKSRAGSGSMPEAVCDWGRSGRQSTGPRAR